MKRFWLYIIFLIGLLGSLSKFTAEGKVSRREINSDKGAKPNLNPVNTAKKTGSASYKSLNFKDKDHFFTNIVDNYASQASKFNLKGGDGITRNLYQLKGSLRGKDGIFEWIVHEGKMSHRRFIPNGQITGLSNQIPK